MSKKSRKKFVIAPEDLELFAQAMQGTKPLPQRKVKLETTQKIGARHRFVDLSRSRHKDEPPSYLDGSDPRDTVQSDDFIAYNQNSISHKTLRNLRKGQYNVEAVLDLHRKTIEEARIAVDHFLHECLKNGVKTAIIVHGKGKPGAPPALKNQVNHWLRHAEPVLAFCSATPRDGGTGAVYILLKRARGVEKFE